MKMLNGLLFWVVALVFMPSIALATEVVAEVATDDGGFIAAIIAALPALVELMPTWFGVVIGVLYAVAHAIALLPTSITANWPSWLKSLINLLAANYGKAKNADG